MTVKVERWSLANRDEWKWFEANKTRVGKFQSLGVNDKEKNLKLGEDIVSLTGKNGWVLKWIIGEMRRRGYTKIETKQKGGILAKTPRMRRKGFVQKLPIAWLIESDRSIKYSYRNNEWYINMGRRKGRIQTKNWQWIKGTDKRRNESEG